VHLLADERGAVIESVVARTQRMVESAQTTVRILALSATLPNYKDVAMFLRVNPVRGLFFFGPEFRPVPLKQTFIGITEKNRMKCAYKLNEKAFDVCLDAVRRGHQVMVFVHARKDTVRTAQAIRELAIKEGVLDDFLCSKPGDNQEGFEKWDKQVHVPLCSIFELSNQLWEKILNILSFLFICPLPPLRYLNLEMQN
jgi:replicative superfamily II helicase